MRILSWNLLWRAGATADDVAFLIQTHRPDLVLLQECTAAIDTLADIVGGHWERRPMRGRQHGLAAWCVDPFTVTEVALPLGTRLDLPVPIFRLMERRIAVVVHLHEIEIANVHLDHGQVSNRRQLRHLLARHPLLTVISGDFNAFGSTKLAGFTDAGPRTTTHRAKGVLPLRLDRCLIRGLRCTHAITLPYGASDHRPFLIDLEAEAYKMNTLAADRKTS